MRAGVSPDLSEVAGTARPTKLAIIVSHPIQYYAPLYRRLAAREDIRLKVFFTWHAGQTSHRDHGFERQVQWDIPVTDGYDYELVPNTSRAICDDRASNFPPTGTLTFRGPCDRKRDLRFSQIDGSKEFNRGWDQRTG